MSHGGASEASAKGGRPEQAAADRAFLLLGAAAAPPVSGKDLFDLVKLRGPAPEPGDTGGRCFRRSRLPRPGGNLEQRERLCSSAGGHI